MSAAPATEPRSSHEALREFIAANAPLEPIAFIPEIRLHRGRETSGLSRLAALTGEHATPFWAFAWAGGLALARHVLDHPELVAGRRVLDFGAGSGLVAIAAAKSGARAVTAVDIDPAAIASVSLNAEANDVAVSCVCADIADGATPNADIVLAGDVFYERPLARRSLAFLRRCANAGLDVLIGDPNRAPLPRSALRQLAHYQTGDVGAGPETESFVYALR